MEWILVPLARLSTSSECRYGRARDVVPPIRCLGSGLFSRARKPCRRYRVSGGASAARHCVVPSQSVEQCDGVIGPFKPPFHERPIHSRNAVSAGAAQSCGDPSASSPASVASEPSTTPAWRPVSGGYDSQFLGGRRIQRRAVDGGACTRASQRRADLQPSSPRTG